MRLGEIDSSPSVAARSDVLLGASLNRLRS